MKSPETPHDEQARLETLQALSILDTAPEEQFDRLTRTAKRLFGVPIALISLVDENRQWFKSCVGLGVSETPRDISFCGHAILGDGLFIIPDTLADDRFADNPLVLNDPCIRFYAGCPLKAPNGQKLGTLCVIGREPRYFDEDDRDALTDLAAMVEHEFLAVEMATVDALTDISNRRGFLLLARHSLRLSVRQHTSAALVFMDLDNLKAINDTFGHAEGDRALQVFSDRMRTVCRDMDPVARLGGDEFAILMINATRESAEDVVSRLRHSIEEYNRETAAGYSIQFSYGIVEFHPDNGQSIESLLAEADSLMYKLKRSKR